MKIKRILQLTALSLILSSCASLPNITEGILAKKVETLFTQKGYVMTGDMVCKFVHNDVPGQFKPKKYTECNGMTQDSHSAEFKGGELLRPDKKGHKSHFHGFIDGKQVFLDYGEDDI